jgi:hypothetical protein
LTDSAVQNPVSYTHAEPFHCPGADDYHQDIDEVVTDPFAKRLDNAFKT